MTFKEYVKRLLRPSKVSNYSNSPKYYNSWKWLEGGQDVRVEMSITEVEEDNVKNAQSFLWRE